MNLFEYIAGLDAGVIIAIVALISTIIVNGLQFLNQKSQGKKAETEASGILIDMALKVNKQEMDTMRELITSLKIDIKEKDERIDFLEKKCDKQDDELSSLKRELDTCLRRVSIIEQGDK